MITIVVASAHLPTVGEAVRAILAQDEADRIDAVLVAGDDVHGVVPDDPKVARLDELPAGPACRAYNAGVARARSPFVAFVDGDCLPLPDWLGRILARHAEGWDAVAGGVVIPPGGFWATAYNYAGFHDYLATRPSGARNVLPSMNLSFRRSVAEAIGPVREDIPRLYDFDWTLRMRSAGFRLYFDAAARVRHYPCGVNPRILWRTWYAGGACSQAVRRQHRGLISAPKLLNHPYGLAILSPVLATALAARVASRDPGAWRAWAVLPAVWLSRLAWCLGASRGCRRGAIRVADYRTDVVALRSSRRQR
jgi:GT2 family glycosyltransferase